MVKFQDLLQCKNYKDQKEYSEILMRGLGFQKSYKIISFQHFSKYF